MLKSAILSITFLTLFSTGAEASATHYFKCQYAQDWPLGSSLKWSFKGNNLKLSTIGECTAWSSVLPTCYVARDPKGDELECDQSKLGKFIKTKK
jgi:hypothetical protein